MDYEVLVRAPDGIRRLEAEEYVALATVAALSWEPETWDEFLEASSVYEGMAEAWQGAERMSDFESLRAGRGCAVDLVGRSVLVHGWDLRDLHGCYWPDEDEARPQNERRIVWMNSPPGWRLARVTAEPDEYDRTHRSMYETLSEQQWGPWLEQRAAAAAPRPRCDAREVLFGPPLIAWLAEHVLQQRGLAAGASENELYQATKAIHVEWMMTPREDLVGRTPRDVLLERHHFLDMALQYQCERWSIQKRPPPALPCDSAAYRWAGFSTAERVMYFDMIREMLARAWKFVSDEPEIEQTQLEQRLREARDQWLSTPHEECDDELTPAEIIEASRRRLPLTGHPPLHDDCPLCQELAQNPSSPMFFFFDGHHLELEDEFAFSTLNRNEFDEQQRQWSSSGSG